MKMIPAMAVCHGPKQSNLYLQDGATATSDGHEIPMRFRSGSDENGWRMSG